MQLIRWAGAAAVAAALAITAGCASSSKSSTSTSAVGAGGAASSPASLPATGSPTGSGVGVPVPAPSDQQPLTVTGPVKVSVLSLRGPFAPAGPVLDTTVSGLLKKLLAGNGGKAVSCPTDGCWTGAKVPAGSALVAVRVAPSSCATPRQVQTSRTGTAVRLQIQLANSCRVGQGSAARSTAMLLAITPGSVPAGPISVSISASLSPGQPFLAVGTATGTMP